MATQTKRSKAAENRMGTGLLVILVGSTLFDARPLLSVGICFIGISLATQGLWVRELEAMKQEGK